MCSLMRSSWCRIAKRGVWQRWQRRPKVPLLNICGKNPGGLTENKRCVSATEPLMVFYSRRVSSLSSYSFIKYPAIECFIFGREQGIFNAVGWRSSLSCTGLMYISWWRQSQGEYSWEGWNESDWLTEQVKRYKTGHCSFALFLRSDTLYL